MRAAIALSRRALGTTWPNPPVGCVIVRDNIVVGQGVTAPGGRPHAETQALALAGPAAEEHPPSATASAADPRTPRYVSLILPLANATLRQNTRFSPRDGGD